MKTLFKIITMMLLSAVTCFGQAAHQHQAPPTNNYPFSRGLFVDCMNEIVSDYKNGSPLAAYQELKIYIQDNFITYIALCDLDHGKVIGNSSMEPSLKRILTDLRTTFPSLKIGLVGKQKDYTASTPRLKVSDFFSISCRQNPAMYTTIQLDSIINTVSTAEDLQRSETIKFFLRAMKFSAPLKCTCNQTAKSLFDVLYVDFPYWENASLVGFTPINQRFASYCSSLQFLQMLKCSYTNYTVESEFQPTDLFWMNGWTITDQIEQADKLIDRMMIPFYTDPYSSSSAFNVNCRLLHLLSDRFSKNATNFYVGFSAQSNSYSYCNSTTSPQEHLGKYLEGSISPSGNLYSVEAQFLNKLNDPNYMCPTCSCRPYDENQYSVASPASNFCSGSMWLNYSMLKSHQLFKTEQEGNEAALKTTEEKDGMMVTLESDERFAYQLTGLYGVIQQEEKEKASFHYIETDGLKEGLYILTVFTDAKKISRIIPVHYK